MKNVNRGNFGKPVLSMILFCLLSSFIPAAEADTPNRTAISNVFSGALITVWATRPNNWLWGYTPYDARSWVDLYNWDVIYNSDSTLTFKNRKTNYCMVAYDGRGLTHNTCNGGNNQKFSLWPTASGAVQIKSISLGKCIKIGSKSNEWAFKVEFTDCTESGSVVDTRQLWILGPERNASKSAPHDKL
ncbi:Cytolethal distending toxin subunit A [Candidatus Burkholderia humilis]|nr:Cytolethal distending toxin subunit A [Candidatus Burkholderia humilis]